MEGDGPFYQGVRRPPGDRADRDQEETRPKRTTGLGSDLKADPPLEESSKISILQASWDSI